MSRIGRKVIELPKGVSVQKADGSLRVKGPKGELEVPVPASIS
ncbi:MAG TPA: 50S ribosomal protein L6, partial [Candidatus Kapabacteria bacterium]|nr:50S ribosomal protein L6 [Candidatus Kapabacteria bacterium]